MGKIRVSARENGKKMIKYWNTCIGAGRAGEGLRAVWQKQLQMAVRECGFQYIRFHGLLCDEMGVYRREGEREFYNYAYIDMLFDALLEMGIRPFVEFGFMPEAMAGGDGTQFWWKGNVTPPADYEAWGRLLDGLVRHWIERYGLEEVEQWYFEIWNEADLHAFWHGTKSQYFRLYQTSVNAIKGVCDKLRVGGPATSNFVPDSRFDGEVEDVSAHKTNQVKDLQSLEWKGTWIADFLHFCETEHLPVDFVSTHPYPTDFAVDNQREGTGLKGRSRYVDALRDDLTWLRNTVDASAYKDAKIHLTEWSSSPTSRDCSHDSLAEAAYIIKCNLDSEGLVDSLSYWVFTDIFEEQGPGPEPFHGGFGLLNMQGIKKPAYHTYRFLNALGEEVIWKTEGTIITKNQQGKLRTLLYHYPKEVTESVPISAYPDRRTIEEFQKQGEPEEFSVCITQVDASSSFRMEILDQESGNVVKLWESFGCPSNLTREQETALKTCGENLKEEMLKADETGTLCLNLTLRPWNVVLISEQ